MTPRALALCTALLLASCGEAPPPAAAPAPVAAPTPAATSTPTAAAAAPSGGPVVGDVEAGAVVYANNCIACHQKDGTGMGGALGADFVNDPARRGKSNEQLANSIAHGVPDTSMVAWDGILDEKQRTDVLGYIRATFMK
jgi:mono/diheme cytochrome c family protein